MPSTLALLALFSVPDVMKIIGTISPAGVDINRKVAQSALQRMKQYEAVAVREDALLGNHVAWETHEEGDFVRVCNYVALVASRAVPISEAEDAHDRERCLQRNDIIEHAKLQSRAVHSPLKMP